MIRYALACDEGHALRSRRQSWRRGWRERKGAAMRPCPRRCPRDGHRRNRRHLKSLRKRRMRRARISPQEHEFRKKLKELREHLTRNADYVGRRFPEEARKMHNGEIERRSVYGRPRLTRPMSCTRRGSSFTRCPCCRTSRTDQWPKSTWSFGSTCRFRKLHPDVMVVWPDKIGMPIMAPVHWAARPGARQDIIWPQQGIMAKIPQIPSFYCDAN
jgi:hypothetical protein